MAPSLLDTIEFAVARNLRIAEDVVNLRQMACFGSHNGSADALDPGQIHGLGIVLDGKGRAQNKKPVQSRRYSSETPGFSGLAGLVFRHALQKCVKLPPASHCVAPHDGG